MADNGKDEVGQVSQHKSAGWRGKMDFKKYRTIIVSVVIFLLFDLTVLGLNYYYSFKVQQSAVEINIAARQTNLIQQIAKTLSDINLLAQRDFSKEQEVDVAALKRETYRQFDELKRARDMFDGTLGAFEKGGNVIGVEGNSVRVNPINIPSAKKNVALTKDLWEPFLGLIDKFAEGYDKNNLLLDNIQFAADYARIYNSRLSNEMGQLTAALEQRSQQQAFVVRVIQIIGIIAALAIFLFIVFRALRQLLRADSELAEARQETTEIMQTVNEGLFLVDKGLSIGSQYSARLEEIIGQRNIGGKKLAEVLSQFVPEKDLEITETFIDQLYSEWVVEELITDLNPLRRIRVEVDDFSGYFVTRFLDFKFSRVYQGEDIARILVSVSDITEAVLLGDKLAKEREQNDRQIEMLSTILNVDDTLLKGFIRSAKRRTDDINDTLRTPEKTHGAMQDKARKIYREIHSLKGESSALGLHSFVSSCQSFEDSIKQLQSKPNLGGNDFLSLTVMLDELLELTGVVEKLSSRINLGTVKSEGHPITPSRHIMQDYYIRFAEDIAERNHKKVSLSVQGMDDNILSDAQKEKVQDISVQFLRNAIVHGIETPVKREAAGKPVQGNIQLFLVRSGSNSAELIVEDDGAGIDYEAIRTKAAESGKFDAQEVAGWDKKQLLALMFSSGFSTAGNANEDAGRGVGMDIIKEHIKALDGKLRIASAPQQYTRFTINFPLE